MDTVELVASLEDVPTLHAARLLVLLNAFSGGDGSEVIKGLTKLAKLDFLLRYPVMLERALQTKRQSIREVKIEEHERLSVESQMVRYRFGPWDHRYREFLNILAAKGLVSVSSEGRAVVIAPTPEGRHVAEQLGQNQTFEAYARRSRLLKRHFDVQATTLMKFIYDTFPEMVSLRSNKVIPT